MLIKEADDRETDIAALKALRDRPDLDTWTRERADQELRRLQAGGKGERESAYEIELLLGANKKHATIHDLRIDVNGRVAQIDHLIIDRSLGITVCQSKHFAEGVRIDEFGEWTSYRGRDEYGIASPIEENRKHIEVLQDVFDRGLVEMPSRLGLAKPRFSSLILISPNARIDRPRGQAGKRLGGLDTVIKTDQLRATLDRQWAALGRGLEVGNVVSAATLERVARDLAALHRPIKRDWQTRFGVSDEITAGPVSLPVRVVREIVACHRCGVPVSETERRHSRNHPARFAGRILCLPCQARPRTAKLPTLTR